MRRFLIFCVMLLLGLTGFCAWQYYHTEILPEKRLEDAEKKQAELFLRIRPEIRIPNAEISESAEISETSESEEPSAENLLSEAEKINSAAVGWIYIPGTNIDYPVVQSEDNDFYLHHGFDGEYNDELGCPFLDCRCERDFSGYNAIVYAHNIEGRAMFADIALYKDKSFMQNHRQGYLILDDGIHTVEFFAYLTVPSNDAVYHTVFITDAERQEYGEYLLQKANYSLNPEMTEKNHLLLLSTCTFEYDEARGVLVGAVTIDST